MSDYTLMFLSVRQIPAMWNLIQFEIIEIFVVINFKVWKSKSWNNFCKNVNSLIANKDVWTLGHYFEYANFWIEMEASYGVGCQFGNRRGIIWWQDRMLTLTIISFLLKNIRLVLIVTSVLISQTLKFQEIF